MPKNKGKGGKNRRRGKNENDFMKRELDLKEEGQEYGQVSKMLGNGRVQVFCFDGKQRVCHIRGKLRKKVWINVGDIILVGLRDYQDDKGDVILKYTPDEARRLKNEGLIPENAKLNENDEQDEGEVEFLDHVGDEGEAGEAKSDSDSSDSDSEKSDEEAGSDKEEESDDDSEEESDEDSDDSDNIREEDLAAGRGFKEDTRRGGNRGGKNKYGKRR
ncbi:Eukaryotic translation initiation factor 4C [Caenorhabditis elegans]|uniref:Eukaryotic translation initiation factor 4C n=1 Tax=Caenorhabditis elegans TaxID=6239 RepID=Q9TXU7_CAEEL|nr:Eukaryotic translation initiation factor 4C [Caenorhabditis elegans]CCD72218.1 Eukaryotic translation initiation factor 4C [Caenorhabditis elegans]|eukprot:NP_500650.1 Eukaryotic Initiation Factor [Caenorhabditis elegans]